MVKYNFSIIQAKNVTYMVNLKRPFVFFKRFTFIDSFVAGAIIFTKIYDITANTLDPINNTFDVTRSIV